MIGGIVLLIAFVLVSLGFGFLAFKLLCLDDMSPGPDSLRYTDGIFSWIASVSFLLTVIIMLIAIPFCRNDDRRVTKKFEAFVSTVESARQNSATEFERVKLTEEIADWNVWLAGIQYDNHNYWGLWTDNVVDDLKPIE